MKIGIDGGALSVTDDRLKLGVYRVSYNLVKELQAADVKNDYRVYCFDRVEEGNRSLTGENVELVSLPRLGFQKVWQTIDIIRKPIDVYLGISQAIPPLPHILCDVRKIGFIYDVGFLTHPEFYSGSVNALTRQTANLVSRSNQIITITSSSKDAIVKAYGIDEHRVRVAYLGVDPVFQTRGSVHHGRHPYFLFVGALKPGKNVPRMIRAFAEFIKQSREIYDLLLIGSDYWLDPEIQNVISSCHISDRVKFVGFVSDSRLARYYRGAEALLTVSVVEGFGLPAAEAMACGCPVIASDGGPYPEVVGDAGILVPSSDIGAIRSAIGRITMDRSFRSDRVALGKIRAKQFTWRKFGQSILSAVKSK